ncbi:hypothetical protein GCM10022217_04030 [Chryseobacterium ginsenosidimutans]|uniref:sigma factor-like helix-turn-helix DNA-binding protein n=1 Tax=Chryseobacterium ginsenosidimutans TaxID=687846 RepID=UPI0031E2FB0C
MTIDEIYEKEDISIRSYNICKYNGLDSIGKLMQYYLTRGSFEKLRNCGRRSSEELIEVCKKYQTIVSENIANDAMQGRSLEEIISSLTRTQREVINSFIVINSDSLSVRSRNGIAKFVDGNFKVKNFAEKLLVSQNFKIRDIDNIGAKCIPELDVYISIVKDFILEVSQLNDEKQLITLKNEYLIQKTFLISKIPVKILESENIFQIIDFLLNKNAFFNENYTVIIKKGLKIYRNEKVLTLDEIALEMDLTRERVRQIRKDALESFYEKLLFIKNFNDNLFQNYGLDISTKQIEITDDIMISVNDVNDTNFSKEFISFVLSVYLNNDFSLLGNVEDVLLSRFFTSRNRHNWNNIYLIRTNIIGNLDFSLFVNDIEERINERIEETYSFNFKSYLSRFITKIEMETIDSAFPVAEKIIRDEFELYLDLDDNIVFKKNTIKQSYQYAYEALENLGQPSKVEEILKKIIELYPNYDTDQNKVRASMKRKDGFVPVGRDSIFGLKKWEKELEDFKGGTIRSIAIEFLEKFNEPKHISSITEYVLKYRPKSNDKSIYYNLRIDESKTFIFFKNSHIGINTKTYEKEFEVLDASDINERNSWEDRFEDLNEFLSIEKRLPFSNNDFSEEENKLYRWLNVQKRKIKFKELDEQKEKLIIEIFDKFPPTNGRRRLNSIEKYDELFNFIISEHRLPSINIEGEEKLYHFFYKQRKMYSNNELDNYENNCFLKVSKILNDQNL